MTRPTVTDQNLYLLLPSKISKMAVWYAKDFGVSLVDAMRHIYRSATYKELASAETQLWHYGPVALYEYLKENK